jgi:SOS response regulatory protein OraA/RecX
MKILDLSLAQNLVNKTDSPYLGGGKTEGFDGGSVAEKSLANNSTARDAATIGVRRMFGDKNQGGDDQKLEKVRDLKNCRGYIIKILGLKDYSSRELFNKASKLGYTDEDIQSILDQLVQDNWINDERLVENLIECYQGRKGKAWLQQKLSMRMIDREIIARVLSESELIPDDKFKKQVESKYKVKFGEYIEPKVKQKIAAFLASRGFGNVFGVLKEWEGY